MDRKSPFVVVAFATSGELVSGSSPEAAMSTATCYLVSYADNAADVCSLCACAHAKASLRNFDHEYFARSWPDYSIQMHGLSSMSLQLLSFEIAHSNMLLLRAA